MKLLNLTVTLILVGAMGGALCSPGEVIAPLDTRSFGETVQNNDFEDTTDSDSEDTVEQSEKITEEITEETTEPIPEMPSETNSFVTNYLIGKTEQDKPFFDTVLPIIEKHIKEYNKHSVTPYYDKLPISKNKENFQGLGSRSFANINGKTVTAEVFYREHGDSLYDPNCGMGLLLYQCIQYKRAHPEEDVKITFSSYRTSATASVCVIPESKYYGYMRSLYGTNYDEQGFVRISYMLVEAARMGIDVTMVNQRATYSTTQYDPSSNSLRSRAHINYKTYFNEALKTDCYVSYVGEGKKVSDYLKFVNVAWTVSQQTTNMQHVKGLSVSHYLATDGSEHTNAVFLTTSNLDENNYRGCNGNSYDQTGVIISDHEDIYRANYNYNQLMVKYAHQEGLQEFRLLVNQMNNEQIELINCGKADEIPLDERIVYLGSPTDPVFELYFTPLGGSVDTWDTTYNPICKYISKLATSEDYIEYASNQYEHESFYVGYIMERMIEAAYCDNPNSNNKISIRITGFDIAKVKKLKIGDEIGYCSIKNSGKTHSKDHLVSYVEGGQRHYVTIMSSANLYMIAFNYRTNSILVIHETDETGNGFYTAFGYKYTNGMIKANEEQ